MVEYYIKLGQKRRAKKKAAASVRWWGIKGRMIVDKRIYDIIVFLVIGVILHIYLPLVACIGIIICLMM